MAFLYFRGRVDFAVLEGGLGGRLDATNIVEQEVSVITSLGMDHQEFLGNTLEAIASEKAGIIKAEEPVVIGPSADLAPIRERAGSRLIRAAELDFSEYPELHPRLLGRHQMQNIAVAIRTAECLNLNRADIIRGVNNATWPGRLERIGPFLLDGAHNVPAVLALSAFLQDSHPEGVWIIFGAMADKQYEDMLAILKPHAQQFVFTKPQGSRAKDPAALQGIVPSSHVEETVDGAIAYARKNAPAGTTILICGSLYVIGEARKILLG
jgi:dihydrofolate synthase/folylpolyglutamate synthase